MTWDAIISGLLGSSPLAGAMGVACWKLWEKVNTKEKVIEDKDRQIAALNEARLSDLKAMLKQDD